MSRYYLTTPIYYVNAAPHIGHAYTTIAAEVIARVKRMQGFDVVLTSGTDEHGTKVERAARAQGKTPEEFVDLISGEFQSVWKKLDLKIDRFQRTTAPNHAKLVNQLFHDCQTNGYIYKGSYTGLYSVVSEAFVNDAKPGTYGGAVIDGVKHFQARHGLTADGRLGKDTLRQLNTPDFDRIAGELRPVAGDLGE